jgi:hypothetical protein
MHLGFKSKALHWSLNEQFGFKSKVLHGSLALSAQEFCRFEFTGDKY